MIFYKEFYGNTLNYIMVIRHLYTIKGEIIEVYTSNGEIETEQESVRAKERETDRDRGRSRYKYNIE